MSTGNIPKINLRNSVSECGQSVRKENFGKFPTYSIQDCKASIAAGKIKYRIFRVLEPYFGWFG